MSNTFWGYPMDVPATIKEVIRRNSKYKKNVRSLNDLDRSGPSMFSFARETFGRECGIRNLRIERAWIGRGRKAYCWALPPTMNPACRSAEDTERLNAFLKIIGYTSEPMKYCSARVREPPHFRDALPIPKIVEDKLWEACLSGFRSGAILEELEAEDIAKANRAKSDESLAEDMAKAKITAP